MNNPMGLLKVFLCCAATGVLSACYAGLPADIAMAIHDAGREIDTQGAWGIYTSETVAAPVLPVTTTIGGRNWIRPGETTKNQVLAWLSTPEEKTSDDRFFLYRYEMQTYKVRKENGDVVERIPVGRLRHARLLVWFTQTDFVKRRRLHVCQPTAKSALKCHSANQMCEMIKGLKEEHLTARYCDPTSTDVVGRGCRTRARPATRIWGWEARLSERGGRVARLGPNGPR